MKSDEKLTAFVDLNRQFAVAANSIDTQTGFFTDFASMKTIGRPIFIIFSLICAGFLPQLQAVSPPPDGDYPGESTAEGTSALFSLTSGLDNTALGFQALYSNTIGNHNVATGARALYNNTFGNNNVANGYQAMYGNTSGSSNTAIGVEALASNTTGFQNTATGLQALSSNTTGFRNTATGHTALFFNTTGSNNTANGFQALYGYSTQSTGSDNTANGAFALGSNSTGYSNTANGANALKNNTSGSTNTASGVRALGTNTSGTQNTANGVDTLHGNTTGYRNTANGSGALFSNVAGHDNTAIGFQALSQSFGSDNVALGFNAGLNLTSGGGNVYIGYGVLGVAGENNTTRIGNVYASAASGRAVYVNADNKIGTLVSSRRFKEQIKPIDEASEAILALNPVTFHYKKEIEPNGPTMFGLIAEDVEKVDLDLVTRNEKGEAETVRYDAVNAMLLNEFLKEHRKVEQLEATVVEQRKNFESKLADEQKQIEALSAGLQKVSAQLEVSKAAPQTVLSND